MLEPRGFQVFDTENGREALALIAEPEFVVDILVTDVIMPIMNGGELANRASSIKPSIKVLFISAYTSEILNRHHLCPDGADLIKKPFTQELLLERIRSVWTLGPRWKELVGKNGA